MYSVISLRMCEAILKGVHRVNAVRKMNGFDEWQELHIVVNSCDRVDGNIAVISDNEHDANADERYRGGDTFTVTESANGEIVIDGPYQTGDDIEHYRLFEGRFNRVQ